MDTYQLTASHDDFGLHSITIEVREVGNDFMISCKLPRTKQMLSSKEEDCFAALQGIRRKAEGRGWNICCKGARQNVWPSAMSRQMGGGVKAYVLEMGRQGRADQLVDIFDCDTPEFYSTVAAQEIYAQNWFQSLR